MNGPLGGRRSFLFFLFGLLGAHARLLGLGKNGGNIAIHVVVLLLQGSLGSFQLLLGGLGVGELFRRDLFLLGVFGMSRLGLGLGVFVLLHQCGILLADALNRIPVGNEVVERLGAEDDVDHAHAAFAINRIRTFGQLIARAFDERLSLVDALLRSIHGGNGSLMGIVCGVIALERFVVLRLKRIELGLHFVGFGLLRGGGGGEFVGFRVQLIRFGGVCQPGKASRIPRCRQLSENLRRVQPRSSEPVSFIAWLLLNLSLRTPQCENAQTNRLILAGNTRDEKHYIASKHSTTSWI